VGTIGDKMFDKWYVQYCFNNILKEAGDPPLRLVSRKFFEEQVGKGFKGSFGMASNSINVIWINKNHPDTLELQDTIWHEILHCLFPRTAEWWIELSAKRLSKNIFSDYGFHAEKLNKCLEDVPSRTQLLKMVKATSDAMNGCVK